MDVYSANKALRHLEILNNIKFHNGASAPAHVQLIVNNACNHNCRFCAYRDPTYTSNQLFDAKVMMNPHIAMQTIMMCRRMGVKAIQLSGGGEPAIYPAFDLILDRLLQIDMPFAVVTNGTNLFKFRRQYAMADWIRVSIDAGTPETYQMIRGLKSDKMLQFKQVLLDIEELAKTKPRRCVIGVGFVATPDNWSEMAQCAALVRDAGVDNIRIGCQFSAKGADIFEGKWDEVQAAAADAEALATDSFRVYNRVPEKRSDLVAGRPDYKTCGYQYFTTFIGADSNVYRCCVTAYNRTGLIGNIRDVHFEALWDSDERRQNMKEFCATECERCQFNNQNRLLNYILSSEPQLHENYV